MKIFKVIIELIKFNSFINIQIFHIFNNTLKSILSKMFKKIIDVKFNNNFSLYIKRFKKFEFFQIYISRDTLISYIITFY